MATIIGTRAMVLKVDGDDYSTSVSKCVITESATESSFVSFPTALAGGGRDYTLELTIRQDTTDDSLWYLAWSAAGTDLSVELWPNGEDTKSATYPQITGTVTITEPDGDFLGGEANRSGVMVNTVDVKWKFTAKPEIDITP